MLPFPALLNNDEVSNPKFIGLSFYSLHTHIPPLVYSQVLFVHFRPPFWLPLASGNFPLFSQVLTESVSRAVGLGCDGYPCRWLWSCPPGGTRRAEKHTLSPLSSWAGREAAPAAVGASASFSRGPRPFLFPPLSPHSQPSALRTPRAEGEREEWEKEDSWWLWLQHQRGGWRGERRGSQVFCFPRQLSTQTSLIGFTFLARDTHPLCLFPDS